MPQDGPTELFRCILVVSQDLFSNLVRHAKEELKSANIRYQFEIYILKEHLPHDGTIELFR